jgi:hypothetical protein
VDQPILKLFPAPPLKSSSNRRSTLDTLDSDGNQIGTFRGAGIDGPWGTAIDGDGNVWVANFGQMTPDADLSVWCEIAKSNQLL